MADKNVKIRIDTEADTKGAKQAGDELKKVGDKAKAGSQVAAGSIQALEDELSELQGQLRRLPVGSQEFISMAGKIKVAEENLHRAELAARKLGGTMSRRGNGGMAVLEFSRALEDSQYGIRGVLNNIPGLVAMLGGGAGLAGAISIAAVAATQLWERLGGGAKSAKDPLDADKKSLDETKAIFDEIEEESRKQRDEASKAISGDTERQLKDLDMSGWQAEQAESLEKLRIQSQGRIEIAKLELELARLDADLKTKSGEDAIKLAQRRLEIVQKIRDTEINVTEQMREQEVIAAKRKLSEATQRAEIAESELVKRSEPKGEIEMEIYGLQTQRDELIRRRLEAERKLTDLAEKNRQQAERATDSVGGKMAPSVFDLAGASEELKQEKERESVLVDLGKIDAEIKSKAESLKKVSSEFEVAAKSFNNALSDVGKATDTIRNLEEKQAMDRGVETAQSEKKLGIEDIELREKLRTSGQEAAEKLSSELESILAGIGDAASNPNVQSQADRLRQILSDGLQSGEQAEVTLLMKTLVGQMRVGYNEQRTTLQNVLALIESSISTLKDVDQRIRSQDTELRKLKGQQGRQNW